MDIASPLSDILKGMESLVLHVLLFPWDDPFEVWMDVSNQAVGAVLW